MMEVVLYRFFLFVNVRTVVGPASPVGNWV